MKDKAQAVQALTIIIVLWAGLNIAQKLTPIFRIPGPALTIEQFSAPHGYDILFRDLKPLLPHHGVIGFLSDTNRALMPKNITGAAQYYQAQYALCPLLLEYSSNHEQVVVLYENFQPGMNLGSITNSHTPVTATVSGAILFQRRQKH